jgi:hypothetical protein
MWSRMSEPRRPPERPSCMRFLAKRMESVVNGQTRSSSRMVKASGASVEDTRMKRALFICAAILGLFCIAILGVLRLFLSLNDGTISTWRLAVLFANIFGCVTVICALYARGRSHPRPLPIVRRRT